MTKQDALRTEALGVLGMIGEVRAKCILIKNACRKELKKARNQEPTDLAFCERATIQLKRMGLDLHKYEIRLLEIHEELYGRRFSGMDEASRSKEEGTAPGLFN